MPEAIATRTGAEVEDENEASGEEDGEELEELEEEEEEEEPSDGALDTMKADSNERNAPSKEMRTKNKTASSPATGASPKKRRKVNHGEKYPCPGSFGGTGRAIELLQFLL